MDGINSFIRAIHNNPLFTGYHWVPVEVTIGFPLGHHWDTIVDLAQAWCWLLVSHGLRTARLAAWPNTDTPQADEEGDESYEGGHPQVGPVRSLHESARVHIFSRHSDHLCGR